jgi:hypothetical protein
VQGEAKMGWEKRSGTGKKYFYLAQRVKGRVKKTYCGRGLVAQVAERTESRRRAERDLERSALLARRTCLAEAKNLSVIFQELAELLAEAALLAAGYHRQGRHIWRRWHAAQRQADDSAA